jgi:hypothetical protein
MTDPSRGSILDILGFDHDKLVALAQGMIGPMIAQAEPALVGWVNANAPRIVQSALDKLTPALEQSATAAVQVLIGGVEPVAVQWVADNAAPALQNLLDALKAAFPAASQ